MNRLGDFERKLRALRDARESEAESRREQRRVRMDDEARLGSRFKVLADRLMREIIAPRLSVVAGAFTDAACSIDTETSTGVLRLNTDDRYRARVDICFGVALAGEESVAVYSRPTIIPILMDVPSEERVVVPLDHADDEVIAAFIENQLERFFVAYFALEHIEAYRPLARVIDPVCGMEISRVDAAESARHMGRDYYFCVAQCKDRFLRDPSRYV